MLHFIGRVCKYIIVQITKQEIKFLSLFVLSKMNEGYRKSTGKLFLSFVKFMALATVPRPYLHILHTMGAQ